MKIIETNTRLEAWIAATEFLLDKGSALNVILSIRRPGSDGPRSKDARVIADKFLRAEGEYPCHTVAETIFPGWEYRRRGLKGLFEKYEEDYTSSRRNDWGTYAHRMQNRVDAQGQRVNPLKTMIEKMARENARDSGAFKSCYEIGVSDPEYEIPTYDSAKDCRRVRSGPCLSHLSFKLLESKVHLTAIYRMHDYRCKVLGNLLGLARLQACVAREVGASLGELVIHSTYAYVEKSKKTLGNLIGQLKPLIPTE
jgi:hypothetical protein